MSHPQQPPSQQPIPTPSPPPAASITGTLTNYTAAPTPLPLLDTEPLLPHALVFLPGLTNTILAVPYLVPLATAIRPLGFSLVLPQLTSNLGGWGYTSLESDAAELASCLAFLRVHHHKRRVVLVGHSTGCQDIVHYLTTIRQRGPLVHSAVDSALLQAPVSDREDFEHRTAAAGGDSSDESAEEARQLLLQARKLVEQGKGHVLLPRTSEYVQAYAQRRKRQLGPDYVGVGANQLDRTSPPMTAHRYVALNQRGGEEDFFSSDLDEDVVVDTWAKALQALVEGFGAAPGGGADVGGGDAGVGGQPVLVAAIGAKDQYLPPHVPATRLESLWTSLRPRILERVRSTSSSRAVEPLFEPIVLPFADHECSSVEAQSVLVRVVERVCRMVLGLPTNATPATTATSAPPPPPPLPSGTGVARGDAETTDRALAQAMVAQGLTDGGDDNVAPASSFPPPAAEGGPGSGLAAAPPPPHPPSFDELVELISTGQTEGIPGVREIPLKINEAPPSEARLARPRKPWEEEQQQQQRPAPTAAPAASESALQPRPGATSEAEREA